MARFKVFQQDNSYLFNVNTGIQYTVAFSKASYLLSQSAANPISLWELSFYYTESSPNIKRKVINAQILSDIRETIVHIIGMFRDSELASIVFICDSSDGLEEDRFKIFQNWQYTYAKEAELIQAVFYLAEYELYYYVGIIPLNSIHQEILAEELSNPDIISIKNN